jgi:hypothetical protein
MVTYSDIIQELKSRGIDPLYGEFYDYHDFPLGEVFETFLDFGQTHLERHDTDHEVWPARIYFNTNTTLNACAWYREGFGLIEINKGVIFRLYDLFHGLGDKFEVPELQKYRDLTLSMEVPPEVFMFQIVTLFFFYHELGHLIQRKHEDGLTSEYFEAFHATGLTEEEIRTRHMREMDADWFAGQQMAFHFIKFGQDLATGDQGEDIDKLMDIVSLALAAIYIYFAEQSNGHYELYFEANSHPHPFVRLVYMITCILNNVEGNSRVPISKQRIYSQAIKISEYLLSDSKDDVIMKINLTLLERLSEVEAYINQIRESSRNYPHLWYHIGSL